LVALGFASVLALAPASLSSISRPLALARACAAATSSFERDALMGTIKGSATPLVVVSAVLAVAVFGALVVAVLEVFLVAIIRLLGSRSCCTHPRANSHT
jgi:hypothetical protein